MDLLARLFTGGDLYAGTPGPTEDFWYQPVGALTGAGIHVDAQQALKISAWYRGRDILATVLAMLPLQLHERLPHDGGAELARQHPLYEVLHDAPNGGDDSFQWRRAHMFDLIDHGWAYDWLVAGPRGFADQLQPIPPTLVTPGKIASGRARGRWLFQVRDEGTGRTTPHTQDEIFYLRGAGGKGILEHARSSLGTALATEGYAAQVFGKGTLNSGTIQNPGTLDAEASKRMAASFVTKPGEWHLPKVLEQGSTWVPDTMTPEDAQMLLSRRFNVDDIARWLGLPRMMLENSDPSFGNAEQFGEQFLTINMGGWLSLWEFAINGQLILKPERFYAQFNRRAFERAKFLERVQGLVALKNAAIISADEARGVEDMNKRGGRADELVEAQNITGKPAEPPPPPPPPRRPPPADPGGQAAADDDRVRAIVTESAARLVRKETRAAQHTAVTYAADAAGFAAAVTAFYAGHEPLVAQTLQLAALTAQLYCDTQRDDLLAHGLTAAETWTTDYLVGLALDAPRPDPATVALLALASKPEARVTIEAGAMQVHPASVTVHQPPAKPTKKTITFQKKDGEPTGAVIEER